MNKSEIIKWEWSQTNESLPTSTELHIKGELGNTDSILYHGADWPMKEEVKHLIAAAPEMLKALEDITDGFLYGMGKSAIQLRIELCLDAINKAKGLSG